MQCKSSTSSSTLSTRNVQLWRNNDKAHNRINELQKHIKRTELSFNHKSMQYESQIESFQKKFNEYMIYINIINNFIDNVVSFINSNISNVHCMNPITIQNNNTSSNDVIGVRLHPQQFQSLLSQIETYIYDITKDAINSRMRYNKLLNVNNELISNNKILNEANDITREYDDTRKYCDRKFCIERCDTFNALERRVNVLEKKMQRVSHNRNSNKHYVSTNVSMNNAFSLHDNEQPKSNSKGKFRYTVSERNVKSVVHKHKIPKKKKKKTNNIDTPTTPNITTTLIHKNNNNKHTRNYTQTNNTNNKHKTYLN